MTRSNQALTLVSEAGKLAPGLTIASYFESFSPGTRWEELCRWPPDVFALANLVLDYTEGYRFAVAPVTGRKWPPTSEWNREVTSAAREWRASAGHPEGDVPAIVLRLWRTVIDQLDTPVSFVREGWKPELCETLLTLHAMADEACAGLASVDRPIPGNSFEGRAWSLLGERGSVARVSPARIRITPKTHFAARGLTIRSFSRYLALNYETLEVRWRRIEPARWSPPARSEYNLMLLPWPLEMSASSFRPKEGPLENMDPSTFGFFEFDHETPLDLDLVDRLLSEAEGRKCRVHGLVLPESAVRINELPPLEALLFEHRVLFLVTGVREPGIGKQFGHNYVYMGARTRDGWEHFEQAKHHRWCLDGSQIRQYHLSRALDPSKLWWEAIDLPVRTAHITDIGGGATIAPLICEDLARLDEVADMLRRMGPSLVISLLLDGPQLPQRWPCRYATVLADDPGSTVLTLTAFGMATRSRPAGKSRSRAVAMWSDPTAGLRQIELEPGASALLITTSVEAATVWTADGRRHSANTPSISLQGCQQLRVGTTKMGKKG
jgi:hypothetical protein